MTERLSHVHLDILRYLTNASGDTAAYIGKAVYTGFPRRIATARASACLREMRRSGLVDLLDDEKPLAWRRTPAGLAALAAEGGSRG